MTSYFQYTPSFDMHVFSIPPSPTSLQLRTNRLIRLPRLLQRLHRLPLNPRQQLSTSRHIVDQPNHLASRPHPKIRVPVDEHLPPALARHIRRHLLELPRCALPLDLQRALRDLILEQAGRVGPPSQHERRVDLARVDDRLLDILVNGGLNRGHEPSPHVDALGAERQRGSEALPVGEAATGNKRDAQALTCPAEEDEVRDIRLTDVAGALEAVDAEEIDAEFDGRLRVADCGAFVQNYTAVGFEQFDYGAGTIACGLDDLDALVDADLGVFAVWGCVHRGEEGDIYAEGVRGHGLCFADLFAQVFGGGLCEGSEL
jgi:hypothetical protein